MQHFHDLSDPRRSQRFLANVTYLIDIATMRHAYRTSSTVARSCEYCSTSSGTRISLTEQSRVVAHVADESCGVSHHEVSEAVVGA